MKDEYILSTWKKKRNRYVAFVVPSLQNDEATIRKFGQYILISPNFSTAFSSQTIIFKYESTSFHEWLRIK